MAKGKKSKRINRDSSVHDDETLWRRRMGLALLMDRREIVTRVLDTAIALWFTKREAVSIHILACVAHKNLDAIGTKQGRGVPTLKQTVKIEDIYSAYNDFRHSDGDPEHQDQLVPDNNTVLLEDCVNSFRTIFGFHTPWMMTFAFFQTRTDAGVKRHLRALFPGVRVSDIAELPVQDFAQKLHPMFVAAFEQGLR